MPINHTKGEEILLYLIENKYIQLKDIYRFYFSKGEIILEDDPVLLSFCWNYGELSVQLRGTIKVIQIKGSITYNS